MIPAEYDPGNKILSEKKFYLKLKNQLDDNWTVFHSYSLLSKTNANKLIDGEIDFLVLNPQFGILVIEVKGGQIRFDSGEFYQNGRKIKSPYEQAKTNKFNLIKYLKIYFGETVPVPIGYAVCFPDAPASEEFLDSNFGTITLTASNIEYLSEHITDIMNSSISKFKDIDIDLFKHAQKSLQKIFEFGASLSDKISVEERKVFALTDKQCELLDHIEDNKRVLIKGCAGSGKSIMAVKKAIRLSEINKSVLLLCYNVKLAEALKKATANYSNIETLTIGQFCKSYLDAAGVNTEELILNKVRLDTVLADLSGIIFRKYDGIIVDEGQDFSDSAWKIIKNLLKPASHYYVFYDPDQNIFNDLLSLPKIHKKFLLNINCRNTKKIIETLKLYSTLEFKDSEDTPEGLDIQALSFNSSAELTTKTGEILHELVNSQGLNEDDIIIMGIRKLSNTSIGGEGKAGNFTIIENADASKGVIPYFNCWKFKGLESKVVIIVDLQDERWNKKAIYTAYSRAKHLLYVLKVT